MKIEHTYIVYIVECKDGSYYIGITNDHKKDYGNTVLGMVTTLTFIPADQLN